MYLLLKAVSVAGAYRPSRLVLTLVDVDALGALLGLGKRVIAAKDASISYWRSMAAIQWSDVETLFLSSFRTLI